MPTKYYYDNYLMTLCDIPDSLLRRNIGSKHEQSAAIQRNWKTGAVTGLVAFSRSRRHALNHCHGNDFQFHSAGDYHACNHRSNQTG